MVKAVKAEAKVKARMNNPTYKSCALDPKPGELSMGRLKQG